MKNILLFLFFVPLFAARLDVVIPVHEKDAPFLDLVIDSVEEFIEDSGRIIIISKERYTDRAEWIDERDFPFSIDDVGENTGKYGGVGDHPRRGWYYQQLLKFYAHHVIEGLSDHILILDADTKPNREMRFIDDEGRAILDAVAFGCFLSTYYNHMSMLLPYMDTIDKKVNPVVHHMVFSKEIIDDLFLRVEDRFEIPFWMAFCKEVDMKHGTKRRGFYAGASEYMIYYHFCQNYHREKVTNRIIRLFEKAKNLTDKHRKGAFDFISHHKYLQL